MVKLKRLLNICKIFVQITTLQSLFMFRNIQELQRSKRAAQAPGMKAPPPGALPHPVEQVPVHVNEPKVPAGEQHASGMFLSLSLS